MNNDMIMGVPTPTSSDLQLSPASPDDIFRRTLGTSDTGNIQPITTISPHHPNPRKKRTKMIRVHNTKAIGIVSGGSGPSGSHSGIIKRKKPDPNAPKITRPCTECGKQFWSWKALFGHMRCHPERPWRGINPPPNLHHPPLDHNDFTSMTTKEDECAVACLLMLANTPTCSENIHTITTTTTTTDASTGNPHHSGSQGMLTIQPFRFDLNFPAPLQDDSTCSSSDLDLRLHLSTVKS